MRERERKDGATLADSKSERETKRRTDVGAGLRINVSNEEKYLRVSAAPRHLWVPKEEPSDIDFSLRRVFT